MYATGQEAPQPDSAHRPNGKEQGASTSRQHALRVYREKERRSLFQFYSLRRLFKFSAHTI